MQILVVDDDPVSLDVTTFVLKNDGHEVITASNGREALEILAEGRCRIVISDWMMPEVNGLTLCRSIREGEFSSYIYIILLTTLAEQDDAVAGLSAGADDFVTKPFNPEELRVRIRAAERVLGLETRDLTIFSLAAAVEGRDGLSGNHLERLRRYTRTLGEWLARQPKYREQINGEFLRLLYITSPLHDIGKVAIDEAVLLKPGRLTTEEFEVMKTHAQKGAEILEAALKQNPDADFLRMARDIAVTHHERYDRHWPRLPSRARYAEDDDCCATDDVAASHRHDHLRRYGLQLAAGAEAAGRRGPLPVGTPGQDSGRDAAGGHRRSRGEGAAIGSTAGSARRASRSTGRSLGRGPGRRAVGRADRHNVTARPR
jgi:putative two-component system response regulator